MHGVIGIKAPAATTTRIEAIGRVYDWKDQGQKWERSKNTVIQWMRRDRGELDEKSKRFDRLADKGQYWMNKTHVVELCCVIYCIQNTNNKTIISFVVWQDVWVVRIFVAWCWLHWLRILMRVVQSEDWLKWKFGWLLEFLEKLSSKILMKDWKIRMRNWIFVSKENRKC